jgi:methylenetetrahydrofolate dehydrogenase (NADP+)/methenyltetrahydrofolate cyclohydrolase
VSGARIIDGKAAAARLRAEIARGVAAFVARHGRPPGLRVVLLGDHPASRAYVGTKAKMAAEVGIDSNVIALPAETGERALLARLARLNQEPAVHGILVQLPLPPQIDAARVLDAIDPGKDVDGFHPQNVGRLFAGSGAPDPRLLVPCTPMGCLILLRETLGEDLAGRRALVVGRSNIVGKPLALLLMQKGEGGNATVTVCHSRTSDIGSVTRQADIVIVAIGQTHFLKKNMVRPGAVVVDVGINRGPDGKLAGDVDFDAVKEVASAITPVPGGIGPMTITMLLHNTLQAAILQHA